MFDLHELDLSVQLLLHASQLIPTGMLLCQMVQKLVNKYYKFSYLCHIFGESEWRHSARMLRMWLGSVSALVLSADG